MSPVSSLRLKRCDYAEWVVDGIEACEGLLHSEVQEAMRHLVKRSISAHKRAVIVGSVFGAIGGILVIVGIFYLVRWMLYREAMATDMVIEPPISPAREPQEKRSNYSTIQQNSQQLPPKRMNTPDPGTYMPNHPYALSYGRRDSYPPGHPSAPQEKRTTAPPLPLTVPTFSHPYSQQQEQQEQSALTPQDGNTMFESFIGVDTPDPTIRIPSPVASTVGGVTRHPLSQQEPFSATFSDEAPSTFSQPNSTTPLQGRNSMRVD